MSKLPWVKVERVVLSAGEGLPNDQDTCAIFTKDSSLVFCRFEAAWPLDPNERYTVPVFWAGERRFYLPEVTHFVVITPPREEDSLDQTKE